MWGPKQEKVRKPRVLCLYCWISSMRVSEEERSVRDDKDLNAHRYLRAKELTKSSAKERKVFKEDLKRKQAVGLWQDSILNIQVSVEEWSCREGE